MSVTGLNDQGLRYLDHLLSTWKKVDENFRVGTKINLSKMLILIQVKFAHFSTKIFWPFKS